MSDNVELDGVKYSTGWMVNGIIYPTLDEADDAVNAAEDEYTATLRQAESNLDRAQDWRDYALKMAKDMHTTAVNFAHGAFEDATTQYQKEVVHAKELRDVGTRCTEVKQT